MAALAADEAEVYAFVPTPGRLPAAARVAVSPQPVPSNYAADLNEPYDGRDVPSRG